MKLTTKFAMLAYVSAAALMTSGCVTSGTYKAKEQESIQLSRSLEETKEAYQELEAKNKKLSEEGETLNAKLKKIDTEIAEFRQDIEKLKTDNEKYKLENEKLSQAAKPENLFKALADTFASLQAENAKLKQSLVLLEKVSAKKDPEPPVKLNPVVTKPVATVEENSSDKAEVSPETGKESDPLLKDSVEKPAEQISEQPRDPAPVIDDKLPGESPFELK